MARKKITLAPSIEEKLRKQQSRTWGRYIFLDTDAEGYVVESQEALPQGFVAIATAGQGKGLAVHESNLALYYRFSGKEVDLFAEDEDELIALLDRDELWESIEENMPAERPYYIGVMLQTRRHEGGPLLTLGFDVPGDRENLFVYQGMVQKEEMLQDGLDRELKQAFSIDDFKVLDLFDEEAFVLEEDGSRTPLFTVQVEVDYFEPNELELATPLTWVHQDHSIS